MKTKLPLLLLVMLCISACASRPLVYSEMDDAQRDDEAKLQLNLENSASTIAGLAFKFVEEDKRENLAKSVITALSLVQDALLSGDPEQMVKDLIDRTIGDLQLLGTDIGDVAKDAFDLFAGWIDLPNINDYLPEVVRDRLLAFVRGAITGLTPYAGA